MSTLEDFQRFEKDAQTKLENWDLMSLDQEGKIAALSAIVSKKICQFFNPQTQQIQGRPFQLVVHNEIYPFVLACLPTLKMPEDFQFPENTTEEQVTQIILQIGEGLSRTARSARTSDMLADDTVLPEDQFIVIMGDQQAFDSALLSFDRELGISAWCKERGIPTMFTREDMKAQFLDYIYHQCLQNLAQQHMGSLSAQPNADAQIATF